ncbi:hypothetical protein [Psychrobacillus sp. L4]|uniref:hypothetical protein n=1 Tax=Psychrobacillus sp. L4 TaxID=3236892 RepID=UPI0036F1C3A8
MGTQINSTTLTPDQKEILNLERKYFYTLHNTFTSPEFLHDLREIEKSIKMDYSTLSLFSQKKNKIDIALERIMRFYMYKTIKPEGIYHSSLSSDLAYYTKDALINIDAKSIDMKSNKQDKNKVTVEKNQISFSNKPVFNIGSFPGYKYMPRLPCKDAIRNLPALTYFIKCIYEDDNTNFDLVGISLACVPNGLLGDLFDNDLITGFKTYEYMTQSMTRNPIYSSYSSVSSIRSHWIKFIPRGKDRYYDNTLVNPLYPSDFISWAIKEGGTKFQACIDGGTARIKAETLKVRYDAYNNPWTGYIYISL